MKFRAHIQIEFHAVSYRAAKLSAEMLAEEISEEFNLGEDAVLVTEVEEA